jgi:hypothetical protein
MRRSMRLRRSAESLSSSGICSSRALAPPPGLTMRASLINLARILARTPAGRRLQEPELQPALAARLGGRPAWRPLRAGARPRLVKQRDVQAYESEAAGVRPVRRDADGAVRGRLRWRGARPGARR